MKVKSFIKQFVAIIKGDDAEAQAEKAIRQADIHLNTHIYITKGELMKLEGNVERAKKAVDRATVNNGMEIENGESYVDTLLRAENSLIDAENALKAHKEKMTFLEGRLSFLSKEEDV